MRRKQSESDSSAKRRSGGRLSGSFRPLSSTSGSSSAGSDSEAEVEMRNLLTQSRQRLEHTEALRVRRHLLRPEDYVRMHCYRLRASSWTQLVCRYRKGKGTEEFSISWEDVNAAHECWDDGRSFFLGYLILLLLLTLYIRLHLLCFWWLKKIKDPFPLRLARLSGRQESFVEYPQFFIYIFVLKKKPLTQGIPVRLFF